MRGARVVALLLAVAAAACGGGTGRDADRRAGSAAPETTAPSPGASAARKTAGEGEGNAAAPDAVATRRPAATTGRFGSPGPGSRNNMPLTVTINRTCATRGDTMEAVAVTVPGSQITFAASYAGDNSLIPDIFYVSKETNVTGRQTWRWVIRPQVPDGDAILAVVAAKGNKGASQNVPFRIASAC